MSREERRYQVFVSSTYLDLLEERQAVIAALLECDAFPAGMELFPATDDDAWTLIKRVIDESDYYLLVLGGKYGSIDPADNLSYTEKEYDYAVGQHKPVMAFLHGDPETLQVNKAEVDGERRAHLERFRNKVRTSKHVKLWTSAEGLSGQVALTYKRFIRLYEATGWIRADRAASAETLAELADARKQLAMVNEQLAQGKASAPANTAELSQGDDLFWLPVDTTASFTNTQHHRQTDRDWVQVQISWNAITRAIGPLLYDENHESEIREAIIRWLYAYEQEPLKFGFEMKMLDRGDGIDADPDARLLKIAIDSEDLGRILTQFKALGLIEKSVRKRSVTDTRTYWGLTAFGETETMRLCAVRRTAERTVQLDEGDGRPGASAPGEHHAASSPATVDATVGTDDRGGEDQPSGT